MKINWMHIPFIGNKFRIREIVMADDRSKFIPQVRILFIWRNIKIQDYTLLDVANFALLADAEQYLYKMTVKHWANQIKKIKAHPFDPVFHKLKQKNIDPQKEFDHG